MIIDEITIEEKIEQELKKLKYNFSYKGTRYLTYTIYIIYKTHKDSECDLKYEVYPIVAEKYETSVNNVKCNIRNATDKMYYDCEQDILSKYIGCLEKVTTKMVIKSVLKRLNS